MLLEVVGETVLAVNCLHMLDRLHHYANLALFANVIGEKLPADASGPVCVRPHIADTVACRGVRPECDYRLAADGKLVDNC